MKKIQYITVIMIGVAFFALPIIAKAQLPYRLTDREMKDLLKRIDNDAERFRKSLDSALHKSHFHGSDKDDIERFVKDFTKATDRLKERYSDHHSAAESVQEVLDRAATIDSFMQRHQLTPRAQEDWGSLRRDLDQLADAYHVTWGWKSVSTTPRRMSDDEVRNKLARLEQAADRFRRSLNEALDQSRFDGSRAEDNINQFVKDFEQATDRLKDRFDSDNAAVAAFQEVLRRAARIDEFMRRHTLTSRAQEDWQSVRSELDQLAGAYGVTWTW